MLDDSDAANLRVRVDAGSSSPAIEAARLKAVRTLGERFQSRLGSVLGGRKWFAHFEAWLWSSRAAAMLDAAPVPVLCGRSDDDELLRKLERAGMSAADASAACVEMAACAARLRKELDDAPTARRSDGNGSVQLSPAPQQQQQPPQQQPPPQMLSLSCDGVEVLCSQPHLDKLRRLHTLRCARAQRRPRKRPRPEQQEVEDEDAEVTLRAHAFCCLARLLALQGGQPKAGGMQAACPPAFFDALKRHLGVNAEVFASPLNARFGVYCSAAADVDHAFGSVGSFFACKPRRGAYLANPPFVPALVAAMARRMAKLLAIANRSGERLSFVVVLPHWPEKDCFRALQDGARRVLVLPQADHGYLHGGQHCKPLLWQPANHDSAVLLLQSEAAAKATPLTPAAERELRAAFGQPP